MQLFIDYELASLFAGPIVQICLCHGESISHINMELPAQYTLTNTCRTRIAIPTASFHAPSPSSDATSTTIFPFARPVFSFSNAFGTCSNPKC